MTIKEYTKKAKQYGIIYNFGIGEDQQRLSISSFKKVLSSILFKRRYKYSSTQGKEELIKKIIKKEKESYSNLKKNNLMITFGSTNGIFIQILNLKKRIKKALIFLPTYPLYPEIFTYLNIPFVSYNLEKYCFNLNYEIFLKTINKDINLVILNTPNNPSGVSYNLSEIKKIVTYCKEHKIHLIIDRVYQYYDYQKQNEILEINDYTTYVNSFSKTYNMTGLRLGYLITSEMNIKELLRLQNMILISPPELIQDIAIDSISKGNNLLKKYQKNKEYLEKTLKKHNIKYIPMQGSFYCFINIKEYRIPSYDLALKLCKEKHINLLPSSLFYIEGYLRLSYACSYSYLKKGLKELINFFKILQYSKKKI